MIWAGLHQRLPAPDFSWSALQAGDQSHWSFPPSHVWWVNLALELSASTPTRGLSLWSQPPNNMVARFPVWELQKREPGGNWVLSVTQPWKSHSTDWLHSALWAEQSLVYTLIWREETQTPPLRGRSVKIRSEEHMKWRYWFSSLEKYNMPHTCGSYSLLWNQCLPRILLGHTCSNGWGRGDSCWLLGFYLFFCSKIAWNTTLPEAGMWLVQSRRLVNEGAWFESWPSDPIINIRFLPVCRIKWKEAEILRLLRVWGRD